ncbi:hypothetical protein [Desemzia sp. FAM 23990]|uniref:hypothetical protein n=1 Tax=Desemzia sp. FAM 23990 TaxID=3259520 RepID=UPI0038874E39
MVNRKLKQDLQNASSKRPSDFWGALIAGVSILYGEFIFRVDGYFINNAEPYLNKMPENVIGLMLVFLGCLKLVGLISHNRTLKKLGIWSLSGMWSGLFFVALTFSFGTGYPDPSYIFILPMMIGCFRVSLKGDYSA